MTFAASVVCVCCVECLVEDCDDRRRAGADVDFASLRARAWLELLLYTGVDFLSIGAWLLGSGAMLGGEEDITLKSDLALAPELKLSELETYRAGDRDDAFGRSLVASLF